MKTMTLAQYEWNLLNRLNDRLPVALIPRVEVSEQADGYLLRADLPGVAPQDIEITTEDGVLSLKAERKSGVDTAVAVQLQRRFSLPQDADIEQISARSQHGVLEIRIAKLAKLQPRRIQVAAA
jgi:HSP20 family protein